MVHSKFTFIVLTFLGGLYAQVEPTAGKWQTWVLSSGSQMRLAAPPDAASTAAELQWLKAFTASANDAAKAQIAYWDAGPPAYRWIKIAAQEMVARNVAATLYARDMALVSAAMYDATIASWDSKYAWNRPRPNDASIVPLVAVPRSPGYPSEYAATAGAAPSLSGLVSAPAGVSVVRCRA